MDVKTQLINDIISKMSYFTNANITDQLQDILLDEFVKYDVSEKCTEVALTHDDTINIINKYIATKRIEGLSENTIQRYIGENKRLIDFLNKPVREITTYDIRFYLSVKKRDKKVSNRTLDGMRRCFSALFSWLQKEKYISENPCAALAQIKYQKQIKKPFTATELEKLRFACTNIRDRALVEFLYCTGCRVSEVQNLNIEDIDFEKHECIVLGKGNKERIVYTTETAELYLKKYLKTREFDIAPALFTGKGTKRLQKNGIEAMLKKLGKQAGVKNVHPHRFRRTLATNLLDKGMDIQEVAMILGHADLKTTQIYCYVNQHNVKASYNKYSA